jgi:hypothetical protein
LDDFTLQQLSTSLLTQLRKFTSTRAMKKFTIHIQQSHAMECMFVAVILFSLFFGKNLIEIEIISRAFGALRLS